MHAEAPRSAKRQSAMRGVESRCGASMMRRNVMHRSVITHGGRAHGGSAVLARGHLFLRQEPSSLSIPGPKSLEAIGRIPSMRPVDEDLLDAIPPTKIPPCRWNGWLGTCCPPRNSNVRMGHWRGPHNPERTGPFEQPAPTKPDDLFSGHGLKSLRRFLI